MASYPVTNLFISTNITSGTTSATTFAAQPAGSLLLGSLTVNNLANPINTPSGWTQLAQINNSTSNQSTALFGRIAVGTETGVSFTWTHAASAGHSNVDAATGFIGTPTLDMVATKGQTAAAGSGNASVTDSPAAAAELAYSILCGPANGGLGAGSGQWFSPDGGTTTFDFTTSEVAINTFATGFVTATGLSGSSAEWRWGWTTSSEQNIIGVTFYDHIAPKASVVSQAVSRSANWMERARGLLVPGERKLWRPDLVIPELAVA